MVLITRNIYISSIGFAKGWFLSLIEPGTRTGISYMILNS